MPEENESEESSEEIQSDDENAAKIEQLKDEILRNPYEYDKHIELIELLRESGELEELRKARSKFSQYFPLSPKLWSVWLSDEQNLAVSPKEKEDVGELFEKAVLDYVSADIWQDYCTFALWQTSSPDGPQKIRAIFERALVAVGVHVTKGSLLWVNYRLFENALLAVDPNNADQKLKVDKLFRRQLAVPLQDIEITLDEYKEWSKEPIEASVERNVKAATALLKPRLELEDRLEEENSYETYEEYINLELKEGNPVRICCIYERRATDHCLNPNVWLEYAKYVQKELKDFDKVLEILHRAVRNCPWSGALWIATVRSAERAKWAKSEVCKKLETGLISGISSVDEVRDLWLAYLDFCRRLLGQKEDLSQKEMEDLRTVFRQALEHLATIQGDAECKVSRYWASVEADLLNNMENARHIWSEITMGPAGEQANFWLEYINLEKTFGDSKHLKRLFPRALSKVTQQVQIVGEAWIQFEREEGSLDSFEEAEEKVAKKLKDNPQIPVFKTPPPDRKRKQNPNNREEPPKKKPNNNNGMASKKVNAKKKEDSVIMPPPGYKPATPSTSSNVSNDANCRVFVSNLSYNITEEDLRKAMTHFGSIKELNLASNTDGKSKGFAHVVFSSPEEAKLAIQKDNEPLKGRPMYISEYKPDKTNRDHHFNYNTSLEKNKIFVRGFSQSTEKEAIENLFSQCGPIKETRIPTYRNGFSKSIAYIEFQNASDASKAVFKFNDHVLEGQKLFVAISNPPQKNKDKEFTPSTFVSSAAASKKGPRDRPHSQLSFVPRSVQKPAENAKMSNADFRNMLKK